MTRTSNLIELITTKGLSPTKARLQILATCMQSSLPVDAVYVATKLGSSAHLATIYRTLEKFVSVGLLEQIDFQEGKFRYEFMHGHHHHAVCSGCGKVEDVEDSETEVAKVEQRLEHKSGFKVIRHTLELFGLCHKCQRRPSYVH